MIREREEANIMAHSIASINRPAPGRCLLNALIAAALAAAAELIVIAASPMIAMAPATCAAIIVAVVHGTDDGIARGVLVLTWLVSIPMIWVAGAIPIANGVRQLLRVSVVPPLVGALSLPAALTGLVASGNAQAAVEVLLSLARVFEIATG
jgi:hypothetical protein